MILYASHVYIYIPKPLKTKLIYRNAILERDLEKVTMKIPIQKYFRFLICILLYFTSWENAFCYAREDDYLSRITSLFVRNNITNHENHGLINNRGGVPTAEVPIPAPIPTPLPIPASFLSVLKFGAKGDGTTDDSQVARLQISYILAHRLLKQKDNCY